MTDDIDSLLDRYSRLQREVEGKTEAFGSLSESDVSELASAYRQAVSLLEDYRERATGTGDFGGYMEFRTKFTTFAEGLDDDLPHRDAFVAAKEHIDRRRLSDRNFDQAHQELEPVEELVETYNEVESLREEVADVRSKLVSKRRSLLDRRDHLRDLTSVQPDALDAPVASLKSPIDRYNEHIESDHQTFLQETPAREVLATYERLSYFALLDVHAPPSALVTFLEDHPAGGEPIPTVREYLSFSRSKLEHYVDDPGHFIGEIGPHSGYLEKLSPTPFKIDWPPQERSTFMWKLRELIQAVDRFASSDAIEQLRELQQLCRDTERYQHLRSAARLQQELDKTERELVVSGAVHEELESVEQTLAAIDSALDDSD